MNILLSGTRDRQIMGVMFTKTKPSPASSPDARCWYSQTRPRVISIDKHITYFPPPLPPRPNMNPTKRVVVDLHHDSSTILAFIQEQSTIQEKTSIQT